MYHPHVSLTGGGGGASTCYGILDPDHPAYFSMELMSVYDDLPQIAAASLKSTATIHRHSMQSSAAACHMELGLEASIAAQVGICGHEH